MSRKIERNCNNCGKLYVTLAKYKNAQFCTNKCRGEAKSKALAVSVSCVICGKEFFKNPSRQKTCCSKECRKIRNGEIHKNGVMLTCPVCGKEFWMRTSHVRENHHCSMKCRDANSKRYKEGYGEVTIKELEEYIDCNFETGELTWKKSPGGNIKVGSVVGYLNDGYIWFGLNGTSVAGHNAVWALYYGKWPEKGLDHKNGERSDNAITNLREATAVQNGQNQKPRPGNKSGVRGVNWYKQTQKWVVHINVDKKQKFLGYYKDLKQAIEVRRNAEIEYYGEFSPLLSREEINRVQVQASV